jgi:hypothetical protein
VVQLHQLRALAGRKGLSVERHLLRDCVRIVCGNGAALRWWSVDYPEGVTAFRLKHAWQFMRGFPDIESDRWSRGMPKFFFHLIRDGRRIEDVEGMELATAAGAVVEALRSATQLARESEKQGERYKGHIEATDANGKVVATAPLPWKPLH